MAEIPAPFIPENNALLKNISAIQDMEYKNAIMERAKEDSEYNKLARPLALKKAAQDLQFAEEHNPLTIKNAEGVNALNQIAQVAHHTKQAKEFINWTKAAVNATGSLKTFEDGVAAITKQMPEALSYFPSPQTFYKPGTTEVDKEKFNAWADTFEGAVDHAGRNRELKIHPITIYNAAGDSKVIYDTQEPGKIFEIPKGWSPRPPREEKEEKKLDVHDKIALSKTADTIVTNPTENATPEYVATFNSSADTPYMFVPMEYKTSWNTGGKWEWFDKKQFKVPLTKEKSGFIRMELPVIRDANNQPHQVTAAEMTQFIAEQGGDLETARKKLGTRLYTK